MSSKATFRAWWLAVLACVVMASAACRQAPPDLDSETAAGDVETAAFHPTANDDEAVRKCRNGCNSRCHGARNKSKCVNECRRACEGH